MQIDHTNPATWICAPAHQVLGAFDEHAPYCKVRVVVRSAVSGQPPSMGDHVESVAIAKLPSAIRLPDGAFEVGSEVMVDVLTNGPAKSPALSAGVVVGLIFSGVHTLCDWNTAEEEDRFFELWVGAERAPHFLPKVRHGAANPTAAVKPSGMSRHRMLRHRFC
jgi:hypothetical protein